MVPDLRCFLRTGYRCALNSHRPLAEHAGISDRKYVASQLLSNVTVPKRQFQLPTPHPPFISPASEADPTH
jgi:hypothetical protein